MPIYSLKNVHLVYDYDNYLQRKKYQANLPAGVGLFVHNFTKNNFLSKQFFCEAKSGVYKTYAV